MTLQATPDYDLVAFWSRRPGVPELSFGGGGHWAKESMNWFHQQVCRSGRWRRRLQRELLPWALKGVELGDDVLEIGPGPGATTDLLRCRTKRLTALEVDATAAAALQKRLNNLGVCVVHGDGAAMPFPDSSFSGVVSLTMLHHMPTTVLQDRLLAEARRVLRPGGVFAGFDGVGSFLFRLIHLGDTYTPVNPDTFACRLEAAGFTEVVVERSWQRFRFRATRPARSGTSYRAEQALHRMAASQHRWAIRGLWKGRHR